MSWYSGWEAICQSDASLAEHTWYGIGGAARWLITPRDEAELGAIVRRLNEHNVAWHVLGRGANVLVRDAGFDGAVIKLSEPFWETLELDTPRVRAAAGVDFPRLVRQTLERGWLGLEGLAGIPGTVGGAVRMNAGGKYGNVADHLVEARLMQRDGTCVTRSKDDLGFGYRTSRLDDGIVTQVTFELAAGERSAGLARFRHIWNEKYATQPPVSSKCAGCVFKNPPGASAGALIDGVGLKGMQRGGATISAHHANFILARPDARAQDVVDLIQLAKERVQSETGTQLELELEIW